MHECISKVCGLLVDVVFGYRLRLCVFGIRCFKVGKKHYATLVTYRSFDKCWSRKVQREICLQ